MSGVEQNFLVSEIKKVVFEIEKLELQLTHCPDNIEILNKMSVLKKQKHYLQTSLKVLCRNIKFPESDIYWAMYL
ncbi:CiV15.8g2-like protein [Chelonus insularis]|nr:CiV15.8g2-like protein [Chelonus insularis]